MKELALQNHAPSVLKRTIDRVLALSPARKLRGRVLVGEDESLFCGHMIRKSENVTTTCAVPFGLDDLEDAMKPKLMTGDFKIRVVAISAIGINVADLIVKSLTNLSKDFKDALDLIVVGILCCAVINLVRLIVADVRLGKRINFLVDEYSTYPQP